MVEPTSFAKFEALLAKLHAKIGAREAHALYLGALTSTNANLGPQRLIDRILAGYWNTLVVERLRGRVRLAPNALAAEPTRDELRAFATSRSDELLWFVRGIDAGGGDPMEFGDKGKKLLEGISQSSAVLSIYAARLVREPEIGANVLKGERDSILEAVGVIERLIADLMTVSDDVRREARETFLANAGRKTDDGAQVARAIKVGRNEACPCGSGKKWKKCCGSATTMQ